jgi:hypothetical protein
LNPVGVATSGVLQIDRIPGITPEARQVVKVRDALSARPTTQAVVDFVKVSVPLSPGDRYRKLVTVYRHCQHFFSVEVTRNPAFGEMYTLGIIGRESDGDEAKNDLVGTGRRSSKEWSQ